jgi:hypothetical protein
VQTLLRQASPVSLQESLLQQGWPGPPQVSQVLLAPQPRPAARQLSPAQQGWPLLPHCAQVAPLHPMPPAVHRFPQHAWPCPPQPPQLPVLQTPKPGQVEPCETHTASMQQPPPAQVLAVQQRWPGPPHWAQTPLLHTPSVTHSVAPLQHACPRAPQLAPGAHAQPDPATASTTSATPLNTTLENRFIVPSFCALGTYRQAPSSLHP